MNKYIDDSRLEEKILDAILPLEVVYKEDKGESAAAQLRHGRLDNVFVNRKVINTRYGKTAFQPQIKVYFRAFTDKDSMITIDMFNYTQNELFKKFVIKSINNDFELSDMRDICKEINDIISDNKTDKIIRIIEYIRTKEDLIFEEIAQ